MAGKKGKKQMKKSKKGNGGKSNNSRPPARQQIPSSRLLSNVAPKRMGKMSHVHSTCSITDPFCVHARSAQRPDGGPPTIPFQIRGLVQVTTVTTSGGARMVFIPGVLWNFQSPASVGTDWNMAATYSTVVDAASILNSAKEVRIVSFGVIIRCFLSATQAAGQLLLSTCTDPFPSEAVKKGMMSQTEVQVHNVAAGMEISWISKPRGPTAHNFRLLNTFTNTMTDFDWTSLAVEIDGTGLISGATAVLTAEYVCNVEFSVSPTNNAMASLAKASPAPNRAAIAAASHVQATTPSFIAGGIDAATRKIESYASSALDTIMSEGLAFLFA